MHRSAIPGTLGRLTNEGVLKTYRRHSAALAPVSGYTSGLQTTDLGTKTVGVMTDTNGSREAPSSGIERVARLRVSDSVATQLTQLITQNAYKVGDKLPSERVLSEQFGVSRSSMREAIRGIEASGLVSSSHGVGVFVVSNTMQPQEHQHLLIFDDITMSELFEVRRMLEGDAAALAARRKSSSDTSEMERILTECVASSTSNEDFVRLDIALHQAVAKAAKNRLLSRLYENLEPLLLEYSRRVISLPGRREWAHEGHVKIVEAVIEGEAENARAAAITHIQDVEKDITKFLVSTG